MTNQETEEISVEVVAPSALESLERASIDVQISTAKRYPRNIEKVKRDMMRFVSMDQETAESCFYVLKRGAKKIEGPSVRLAEVAVSCFQNLRASTRLVANDGKTVTAQAVCHDLQNNVCIGWEVKRRITDRDGNTFNDDMQIVTGNAAAAIAFRNAVFKVIPGALINPVYEKAKEIAIGNAKTLTDRRNRMLEAFTKMGVSQGAILAFLQKNDPDEIDLKDIEQLIGVHTAIKEGTTTIDEQFKKAVDAVNKVNFEAPPEAAE